MPVRNVYMDSGHCWSSAKTQSKINGSRRVRSFDNVNVVSSDPRRVTLRLSAAALGGLERGDFATRWELFLPRSAAVGLHFVMPIIDDY